LGEKAFTFINIYTYESGDCIQQEGEQALSIYWILKGNCKVDRIVPFVANPQTMGKKLRKYENGEVLQNGDKLVNLKLGTQDLCAQEYFPTIPCIGDNANNLKYLSPEALDKDAYIEFFSKMYASDIRTWMTCSVRATSTVVVACMNMVDFVRLAPREVLFQLCTRPSIHDYPIDDLQRQYLEEQRWETVRKDIIDDAKLST
jgi:CRP-like cAMP-binding protein